MVEEQTNSPDTTPAGAGVDLHLELSGTRLRAGLTDALREAVRSGRLAPGTRLPPSRALAADLGIARSTVTECYSELVAEGWLTAQQGSRTRVAQQATPRRVPTGAGRDGGAVGAGSRGRGGGGAGGGTRGAGSRETATPGPPRRRPTEGLAPGAGEFAEFPRAEWLTAARRALAAAPPSAFGYGDPLGRMELRSALADYLARVRGVRARPEQILICAGFHQGLTLVAQALRAQGARTIAVEGYGLGLYRELLVDAGLRIPPLPVDGDGARTDDLDRLGDVDAVLLTPAHQFPTGFALSPERRAAVRDWARVTGGVILEDDYDGEFRYDRKPVGALQGLDPDRVVYFGTASKSLAPALRVAWMAVPESLLPGVVTAKGRVEVVSVLEQLTLAEFITSGAFDRHVRSRRQIYRRRREQLIGALGVAAPGIRVTGMAAGLQAVLALPPGTEASVREAAARRGLLVSGMAEFRHDGLEDGPAQDALVVNYSALPDTAWENALATLCSVMPH